MFRLAIFLAVSAAFLLLSWRFVRLPRSHGFYRFFAFEFLVALILWNVPHWFREPFSAHQLVSWFLLGVSLGLAIEGFRLLRIIGKPAPVTAQDTNFGFENTTTMVTVGAYRFIRHPMYASLLGLCWGVCLKHPTAISVALALAASGFLVLTAVMEEGENLARFGAPYAAYMRATRRFVPFVF